MTYEQFRDYLKDSMDGTRRHHPDDTVKLKDPAMTRLRFLIEKVEREAKEEE